MAFLEGRTFRRGLDGRVMEKGRSPGPGRGRRWRRELGDDERRDLFEIVHHLAKEAEIALLEGRARVHGGRADDAVPLLARVLHWDPMELEREWERFRCVYQPVGILPPDQYMALLLQATEGCPWNQCTFCPFYRGRPFRIKGEEEFKSHIMAVQAFLGAGIRLRRSIFLGDANALATPQPRLLRLLDAIPQELLAGRGIYTFMDAFTVRKGVQEFEALRARGLRRVYIGLESGCDPLLASVRKPNTASEAIGVVQTAKAAGVSVGLIILLGLGGEPYFDCHVEETSRVLNAAGLGEGDLIYFSPLVDLPGAEYREQARAQGIRLLDQEEMEAQEAAIREGLHFTGRGPKLARYDVQEFLY